MAVASEMRSPAARVRCVGSRLPAGSCPETRSVRGANTARIAVHRPGNGDLLVILVVEDNLVKGASGQAVQVMNLMFGQPENAGLDIVPLLP